EAGQFLAKGLGPGLSPRHRLLAIELRAPELPQAPKVDNLPAHENTLSPCEYELSDLSDLHCSYGFRGRTRPSIVTDGALQRGCDNPVILLSLQRATGASRIV